MQLHADAQTSTWSTQAVRTGSQLPLLMLRLVILLSIALTQFLSSSGPVRSDQVTMEISSGDETATVIFAHGLGDTPTGWHSFAEEAKKYLPHVRWILPCAPQNPVSVNGGMKMTSWMDILQIPIGIKPPDNGKHIDNSVAMIHSIIDAEIKKGIPGDRIVIGGFSQGAALAPVSAFRYSKANLGGIIMLSGWALPQQDISELAAKSLSSNPPVFIGHGDSDEVVLTENAGHVQSLLAKVGFEKVTVNLYHSLGHGMADKEQRDVIDWLAKVLPVQ